MFVQAMVGGVEGRGGLVGGGVGSEGERGRGKGGASLPPE